MHLQISKSKNSETFYIAKAFRDKSGKSTSKIVERLGSRKELERQVNSGLYERLLLSNDKESVLAVALLALNER